MEIGASLIPSIIHDGFYDEKTNTLTLKGKKITDVATEALATLGSLFEERIAINVRIDKQVRVFYIPKESVKDLGSEHQEIWNIFEKLTTVREDALLFVYKDIKYKIKYFPEDKSIKIQEYDEDLSFHKKNCISLRLNEDDSISIERKNVHINEDIQSLLNEAKVLALLEISPPKIETPDLQEKELKLLHDFLVTLGNDSIKVPFQGKEYEVRLFIDEDRNLVELSLTVQGPKPTDIRVNLSDEGKITSVYCDDLIVSELSEDVQKILRFFIDKIPKVVSRFTLSEFSPVLSDDSISLPVPVIKIKCLQDHPEKDPFYHLSQLSPILSESLPLPARPMFSVELLNENLKRVAAVDEGGVSRTYLNALFNALVPRIPLQLLAASKNSNEETSVVGVKKNEKKYEAIGKLYVLCYELNPEGFWDRSLITGNYFSKDLFALAFALTYEECQGGQPLSQDTRKKLLDKMSSLDVVKKNPLLSVLSFFRNKENRDALLQTTYLSGEILDINRQVQVKNDLADMQIRLLTLDQADPERNKLQTEIDTLQKIYDNSFHILQLCELVSWEKVPEEFAVTEGEELDESIEIFQKLSFALKKKLEDRSPEENRLIKIIESCASRVTSDDAIEKFLKADNRLDFEAIRCIAKGMQDMLKCPEGQTPEQAWDVFRSIDVSEFSNKVQGVIDSNKVAAQIKAEKYPSPALLERVAWIKNWIKNEATEEEIKRFLEWATGSTGIPAKGITIKLNEEWTSCLPKVHTCGGIIELGNPEKVPVEKKESYKTEEGFILFIKEAMADRSLNLA